MKIPKLRSIIILFSLGVLLSGDSAYTLENGSRQIGIFQPYLYGLKNNMEISTHPILFLIKPNVRLKKYHRELKGIGLASRYSFDYPTQLLKLLQREGKFGILSKDPNVGEIPNLFVLQGEWLATKKISHFSLTGKIGMSTCLGCELDSRHLVDYDLAYPRMALYHYGIGTNMGLDWDYVYSKNISLKADMDILLLPGENVFIEHKFLLHYRFSEKYTFSSGYKFSYGHFPFNKPGEYLWNLFPLIDLSWSWEK